MTNERNLLTKANELLQGWLAWSEQNHLTHEQYRRMVQDSQETVDSLVEELAQDEPKADACDHDIEVWAVNSWGHAECKKCGKYWDEPR